MTSNSKTRTWKLNDLPLDRPGQYFVEADTGSPGGSEPRIATVDLPSVDGTVVGSWPRLSAVQLPFRMVVEDRNERGIKGGYPQRRANEAAVKRQLYATLANPGVLTLVEQETKKAKTLRQTTAVLNSSIEVEEINTEAAYLSFSLLLPSPVWQEPSKRLMELQSDLGTDRVLLASVTGGSGPVFPLYVFKGPVQRVEVEDVRTGARTVWSGDVPDGRVVLLEPRFWSWGTTEVGEVWPWDEDSTGWSAVLDGATAAFDDANPLWPSWNGQYSARVWIDGQPLPDSGEVRGLALAQRSFL